jgi:hypothetical protein
MPWIQDARLLTTSVLQWIEPLLIEHKRHSLVAIFLLVITYPNTRLIWLWMGLSRWTQICPSHRCQKIAVRFYMTSSWIQHVVITGVTEEIQYPPPPPVPVPIPVPWLHTKWLLPLGSSLRHCLWPESPVTHWTWQTQCSFICLCHSADTWQCMLRAYSLLHPLPPLQHWPYVKQTKNHHPLSILCFFHI